MRKITEYFRNCSLLLLLLFSACLAGDFETPEIHLGQVRWQDKEDQTGYLDIEIDVNNKDFKEFQWEQTDISAVLLKKSLSLDNNPQLLQNLSFSSDITVKPKKNSSKHFFIAVEEAEQVLGLKQEGLHYVLKGRINGKTMVGHKSYDFHFQGDLAPKDLH